MESLGTLFPCLQFLADHIEPHLQEMLPPDYQEKYPKLSCRKIISLLVGNSVIYKKDEEPSILLPKVVPALIDIDLCLLLSDVIKKRNPSSATLDFFYRQMTTYSPLFVQLNKDFYLCITPRVNNKGSFLFNDTHMVTICSEHDYYITHNPDLTKACLVQDALKNNSVMIITIWTLNLYEKKFGSIHLEEGRGTSIKVKYVLDINYGKNCDHFGITISLRKKLDEFLGNSKGIRPQEIRFHIDLKSLFEILQKNNAVNCN